MASKRCCRWSRLLPLAAVTMPVSILAETDFSREDYDFYLSYIATEQHVIECTREFPDRSSMVRRNFEDWRQRNVNALERGKNAVAYLLPSQYSSWTEFEEYLRASVSTYYKTSSAQQIQRSCENIERHFGDA
jgi:hypothetical protein